MTIIKPNSIAGITSITAQGDVINLYKSDGTLAGLQLNGVNFNTTSGVSTFNMSRLVEQLHTKTYHTLILLVSLPHNRDCRFLRMDLM